MKKPKITNLNDNVLPPKVDWLSSIKKMLIDLGVSNTTTIDSDVIRLEMSLSRPKNGAYVVEMSEKAKRMLTNPAKTLRSAIDSYSLAKGMGDDKKIRFYPLLTREQEEEREKTKYFLNVLIAHYKKSEVDDVLVKIPMGGRVDRLLVENKDKTAPKFYEFGEVAEIVGVSLSVLEDLRQKSIVEKAEKKKENRKRKNEEMKEDGKKKKVVEDEA
ncbi:hypothetical protein DXG03_000929 [Asterophora parasitica]|uniref:Uncharacterized protein n=1 Tax=Asterophora parasitica TaxID=117018 RepID=A0A9P7G3J5_9AGAR|nr:hypothetical protein DXG03_000929 [Asterophora parasitica]